MSGHTPGPFVADTNSSTAGDFPYRVYSRATHGNVAAVYSSADAQLFAAAPDLLEACRPMMPAEVRENLIEWGAAAEETGGVRLAAAIQFLLENEDKRRAAVAKAVQS